MRFRIIILCFIFQACVHDTFDASLILHGLGPENWSEYGESMPAGNPIPADHESLAAGQKVFEDHCVECHGNRGHGDGAAFFHVYGRSTPNLVLAARSHVDKYLFRQIAGGRKNMPSWKDYLEDVEIWNVINYIRSLESQEQHSDEASF